MLPLLFPRPPAAASLSLHLPPPPSPFPFPFTATVSSSSSSSSNRRLAFHFPIRSLPSNALPPTPPSQPPTLFPGGYKRPEISVPTLVLQVTPEEVLDDGGGVVDAIDVAVSDKVGLVVLSGSEGSGKRLYEAACLLKSVVRDRAYLLIGDRVDIAAAVSAAGVLLSDQGLPAIVARNMMTESRFQAVMLPLVARSVESSSAASHATISEGVDFLVFDVGGAQHTDGLYTSLFEDVKVPIFFKLGSTGNSSVLSEGAKLLKRGASGLVITVKDIVFFKNVALSDLSSPANSFELEVDNEGRNHGKVKLIEEKEKLYRKGRVAGFVKLEEREKELIEAEKSLLTKAINVIQMAAPLMEEVSLLIDAVAQIDEPFMLVIVGEFNSGKSTFINALLGNRYLKEGVVPTTNEITFLRYAESDATGKERCERHPDGQYICYLHASILKEMVIVDTPGTNVILQRQQRLTEEFVPRADLLLFVISADRPLTESEVDFLRYTQKWKKKVVFVLNKSDIYQNDRELDEAISFIKNNALKLLNSENVTLYPVSSRLALEAKLMASYDVPTESMHSSLSDIRWGKSSFYQLERFLYSFLDGSTNKGMERVKLKLETPIQIAEQLISSCESLLRRDCERAKEDLNSVLEVVGSVKTYRQQTENESISWRRKVLSLIDSTRGRVLELIESTLQLSNLDIALTYLFKSEKSTVSLTARFQNDIVSPALLDSQKLLKEYIIWIRASNERQSKFYRESLDRRWPSPQHSNSVMTLESYAALGKSDELSLKAVGNVSPTAASKVFDREVREVFLGTLGGLGVAGMSASLLTSVLTTTLEDLLALGFCSVGGFLAIANFPAQRQAVINKVNKRVDALAREVEEAMQRDLSDAVQNLETFVDAVCKPYQEEAQIRLDDLLAKQKELSDVAERIRALQRDIQNLHVS
ncbi:hypothetical protein MLD38_025079 [Melastoma candidum]|uniref:Uncharacterized protein n=1 Tax=Melastoma candidum TaxID=119954 RepID=A0ACB9NXB4_9MYRT|nr:hypothetical protein MLD38_025079 [Melastoma candidum]